MSVEKWMSQGMCPDTCTRADHTGVLWTSYWSIPHYCFTAAQISGSSLGVIHLAVLGSWQGNRQAPLLDESWPSLGKRQECWPACHSATVTIPSFVLLLQGMAVRINPTFQKIPLNKSLGKWLWAGYSSLCEQVKSSGWNSQVTALRVGSWMDTCTHTYICLIWGVERGIT